VLLLVLQEVKLLGAFLLLDLLSLTVSLFDGLDLGLQLDDLVLELGLLRFELLDLALQVGFSVLRLQLLAHGESNRGLIEGLVGGNGHLDLVAHSQQQEAALGLVEGHLADDLIKALREELFADRADAGLASLTLHEFLIEKLSQTRHIHTSGLLMRNILNVVLAALDPLSRRKNGIQDVLSAWLGFHRRQLSLFLGCYKKSH